MSIKVIFSEFNRVDSSGNPVTKAEVEGVLLFKGGTVCESQYSSYFDENSAEAICRLLGYPGYSSWSIGSKWGIQNNYDIKIRNVRCSNGDWSSCTFSTSYLQNCDHSEDIFLTCTGKLARLNLIVISHSYYQIFKYITISYNF